MAIPTRFLKTAANRSPKDDPGKKLDKKSGKKPERVAGESTGAINPTVIGVLLSVCAHGLFIVFGPRTDFSFAALTEAAQQQDAEETIVPLVEISPADRSRLPGFAQPRRLSTPPSGLNGIALNPGVGFPNTSSRRPAAQSGTATRGQTQARSIPSTTSRTRTRTPLPSSTTTRTLSPYRFGTRPTPGRNTPRTSQTTTVLPDILSSQQALERDSTVDLQLRRQTGLGTQNGAPSPPGTRSPNNDLSTSAEDLLTNQIEEAQAGNTTNTPSPEIGDIALNNPEPIPAAEAEEEEGENIPITPPVVATAPAQKDAARLLDGFIYDGRETTETEAQNNIEDWIVNTAENTSDIASATATIEIDSKFKVCKDNPPNPGLIGVLVNPDGSQEQAQVLRSVGYDILNRQALSAVEYKDFGQPEKVTQYQVIIDVIYEPEGCVKELPEVE